MGLPGSAVLCVFELAKSLLQIEKGGSMLHPPLHSSPLPFPAAAPTGHPSEPQGFSETWGSLSPCFLLPFSLPSFCWFISSWKASSGYTNTSNQDLARGWGVWGQNRICLLTLFTCFPNLADFKHLKIKVFRITEQNLFYFLLQQDNLWKAEMSPSTRSDVQRGIPLGELHSPHKPWVLRDFPATELWGPPQTSLTLTAKFWKVLLWRLGQSQWHKTTW